MLPRVNFRPIYEDDGLLWLHKVVTPTGTADLAVFDGRIALQTASVAVADPAGFFEQTAAPGEPLQLKAGDRVQVNMYWRRTASVDSDYTTFVRLVDGATGQVLADQSGPPVAGRQPVKSWHKGEPLRGALYLTVGAAGRGTLVAGLRETGSGQNLLTADGADHATLVPAE